MPLPLSRTEPVMRCQQVWEVSAQLLGLAGSVGLLRAIEATGRPENVLLVWATVQVGAFLLDDTNGICRYACRVA